MKELLLLAFVLHAAKSDIVGAGKLIEFSHSQQEVYGKYESGDGVHGITFLSGADDCLLVRTLSGETLVETSPFVETDGKEFRSVYVRGHEYLQHKSPAHSDKPVNHNTSLFDAMQHLLSMKEVDLLEETAEAVGQRGITGKDTPAALPFFLFVLRVTQIQNGEYIDNTTSISAHRHKRYTSCAGSCPPCQYYNCVGMCGKGCSCWRWVCGNCCWNRGCYYHDLCCARNFWHHRCLFPFGFSCNGYYSC